jgi:membrane-bound lytic murein transglycosylase
VLDYCPLPQSCRGLRCRSNGHRGCVLWFEPEGSPPPQREPQNVSEEKSETPTPETNGTLVLPESENKKFEFIGNPVYDARYRERKSGKRIADFHLATHPGKNQTEYFRIRAFDGLAERARDTVRKGQKGVEVVAYGPKYWKGKRKTENGWKEELIEGYYAGFVRVPKDTTPQKDIEDSPKQEQAD